jgi:hypothetical protein
MLFLLWFDALFSRPFHRIENSVWMALAFAIANRSILPLSLKWTAVDNERIYRLFGGFIAAVSIYGFVFLYGGITGDQLMYRSMEHPGSAEYKESLLRKAETRLMSRDDAFEQRGYFFVELGAAQKDIDIFLNGVGDLYGAFLRRPTSKLLIDLVNFGKQLDNRELLDRLSIYLKPGAFGTGQSAEMPPQ